MSYWVYLNAMDDAEEPASEVFCRNHTSNTAPMWRDAGADLAEMDGRTAREIAPEVHDAIKRMLDQPDHYRAMAPENGWGTYETCLAFLFDLYVACRSHPGATMRVSR